MERGKQSGASLATALLVALVIAAAFSCVSSKPADPPSTPSPKSADQIAAEAKEAEDQAKRKGKVRVVVRAIKEAARDPESVKFSSMRANDDASVVCAEYRARNGFGGTNKEFVVLAGGKVSNGAGAWNKHCTGPMFDMLSVAH